MDNELVESAQALLDWAREHTSPRDPNSPHDLLKRLSIALDHENTAQAIADINAMQAAAKEKFLVETTVYVEVEAESLDALMRRMADEGWTVFTLLDKGASSGDMIIRNEFNDVVGEL